jgi:hypothetical protein
MDDNSEFPYVAPHGTFKTVYLSNRVISGYFHSLFTYYYHQKNGLI